MCSRPAEAPRGRRTLRALIALAALFAAGLATAVERLDLTLQGVSGEGWSSGPVAIALMLRPDGSLSLEASARRARLPRPLGALRAIRARCDRIERDGARIECASAVLELDTPELGVVALRGRLGADLGSGALDLDLPSQRTAAGRIRGRLRRTGDAVEVRIEAESLPLATLVPDWPLPDDERITLTAGQAGGSLRVNLSPGSIRVALDLRFDGIDFSDRAGGRAGEGLAGDTRLALERRRGAWRGDAALSLSGGAVYVEPVLLDASDTPLFIGLDGVRYGGKRADVASARLRLGEEVEVQGAVGVALDGAPRLDRLRLSLPTTATALVYRRALQPFFPAGALSDLTLQGASALEVDWSRDGASRVHLRLDDVSVGDGGGRFTILGVSGDLHWAGGAPAPESRVQVQGVSLGRLDLGAFELRARAQDDTVSSTHPLRVPLLDGAMRISRLEARGLGGVPRMELDAELEPLSLRALSERLAWLPLSGTLGGRVPSLTYERDRISVNGDLELSLFDGRARIGALQVLRPFSGVPEVRGNLRFDGLSLSELSSAMSFGSIEGRLSGQVQGLVMEGLRPVAFDAFLATPEGDRSRRRISQRAVDNLASLGGASAALSTTFLRFFETFSYARLGLGCRLEAGVCYMRGVAPARQGYYIVEGGGLPPRVDVVGFNERVDWDTLLERLRAVASSEGPVVR